MANDVLFVQLTIYQHEQLDYGYDHLHIAGKDGKCCLACEREAMVCVVDDMQHEVKRITDKHKVVNLTTLPGDETELDDTVEDIRGKHNRPLTYDTHLAVADATNQPQGDTHNVQHDHGSPGDDARSSAGIDTAHISGNPGVASIPPAHTVVAQDTPPTESGDPVLTGEQTLDGATAARFPPGSKSRASGNAPARSRTGEKPPKPAKSVKQEPLLPPDKPDMSGAWLAEKCVQYAEWGNKMRYRESEHTRQLEAARAIHRDDPDVTLTQFADAYDERHDAWWLENRGKLHVSELKAKEKNSGIDRLHVMLDRIVAREAKRCNGGRNGTNGTGKPPSSVGYDGKTDLNVYGIQALLREQEAKRGVM